MTDRGFFTQPELDQLAAENEARKEKTMTDQVEVSDAPLNDQAGSTERPQWETDFRDYVKRVLAGHAAIDTVGLFQTMESVLGELDRVRTGLAIARKSSQSLIDTMSDTILRTAINGLTEERTAVLREKLREIPLPQPTDAKVIDLMIALKVGLAHETTVTALLTALEVEE